MDNINKVSFINTLYKKADINSYSGIISQPDEKIFFNSHKLLLEGIDFDLIYTPLKHLGNKVILAAIGPIYAAGFIPFQISVSVALSKKISEQQIEELWEGMTATFKEHNITEIQLDLSPSITGMAISLSSQGKQNKKLFVQRPQCKQGDLLCISGNMGASYLGLQILEREKRIFEQTKAQPKLDDYKFVLESYLSPYIDKALFQIFNETNIIPTECDFVTEGLAHSIKNICARNSLGAKIFMNRIPIASPASQVAEELNIDPMTAVLNGGDDYKFIFAIPLEKHESILKELPQLDIIGHLSNSNTGTTFITPDGQELELKAQAWDK